ncbi:MAG: PAS domain S-box protein [Verrucomicrobiota bacterium]
MIIASSLFDSAPFMPHGHCYLWSQWLVTLHVTSDALIVLAYYSIPITLLYFIRKRKDIEFHWMFACFALFILACGTTHLMEIWNIWHSHYWLSGSIKALTAAASVPTAILLVKLVPHALTLPSARELKKSRDELEQRVAERTRQLEITNATLTREAEERRRAEQASRESEARLRAVLDSTPSAVVVINTDGQVVDWNAQAEKIFGRRRDEVLEHDLTETIIPMRYREAHRSSMAHLLATGEGPALQHPMEMDAVRRDESEFPVELFITPVKTQSGTNYCGFITDLTARKHAEKELRESQNLLQAVINNSPTVIYVKDLEGRYLLANRRFIELFHPSQESIVGKTDYDFFSHAQAEAFRAMDSKVINANQALTEEEEASHADALHTYVSVKCPLRDETGKAVRHFWSVHRYHRTQKSGGTASSLTKGNHRSQSGVG